MKKWFNNGDIAHMSKNKRAKGFMLKLNQPVKIINSFKIEDKSGAYMYTIEVEHPKTKEPVILDEWVTQFDLYDKDMWNKVSEKDKQIAELQVQLDKNGIKY